MSNLLQYKIAALEAIVAADPDRVALGAQAKRIADLEALLDEYKDAECRALKSEGEALKRIDELEAENERLRAAIEDALPCLQRHDPEVEAICRAAEAENKRLEGDIQVLKLQLNARRWSENA